MNENGKITVFYRSIMGLLYVKNDYFDIKKHCADVGFRWIGEFGR